MNCIVKEKQRCSKRGHFPTDGAAVFLLLLQLPHAQFRVRVAFGKHEPLGWCGKGRKMLLHDGKCFFERVGVQLYGKRRVRHPVVRQIKSTVSGRRNAF